MKETFTPLFWRGFPVIRGAFVGAVEYYNAIVGDAFIGCGGGDDVVDGGMFGGDVEKFLVVIRGTGVGSGGGDDTVDGGAFGGSVEMFHAIFAGAGVGSSGNSISGAGYISAMFFGGGGDGSGAFFGDIVGDRGDNDRDIDTGFISGSADVDGEIVDGVDNQSVLIWFIVIYFLYVEGSS